MAATIYILCMVTALLCAGLLLRGYFRTRVRLLFWSGLCFVAFTLENLMLFLDRVVFLEHDLSGFRAPLAMAGVALLLYGVLWEDR